VTRGETTLPQAYSTFEDVAYKFFSDCKAAFGSPRSKRNATLPARAENCYKVEVLGRARLRPKRRRDYRV